MGTLLATAGKYKPTSIPCYSMDFSQLWLGLDPALFSLQMLAHFPDSVGQNLRIIQAFNCGGEKLPKNAKSNSALLVTTGVLGLIPSLGTTT